MEPDRPLMTNGAGDAESTAIVEQYRESIQRYITRIVHDPVEADDLVQETFLRVHRRLHSLKEPAALSAWLYRIATHVCYDHLQQTLRRTAALPLKRSVDVDEAATSKEEDKRAIRSALERNEMSTCVQGHIDQLPDAHRMVILLHEVHGMSNAEIAQSLGCSLATVKIRLHRARMRLRASLAAACEFSCDERGVLVCYRRSPSSKK